MTRSNMLLGAVVLGCVCLTPWLRLNISPSVPYGLYALQAVPSSLPRGTLVVLRVPAVVRPWWRTWWVPFLKPVAAVEGDKVCVDEGMLWVSGVSYGPVYEEVHGQALPHLEGCHVVPGGAVFLASQAARSLDARYWGMTPIQTLTAQAVPLLTWR